LKDRIDNKDVLLLAFRRSNAKFFKTLVEYCDCTNFKIISTREVLFPSWQGIGELKNVNLTQAVNFAVDEFYAKTNLTIVPKFIIRLFFTLFSYINFFRYYKIISPNYLKILIWNGGKFRQRVAIEIARIKGIKVYFFENGLLPNRIVFDGKGINYENSVPRDKEFFQNYQNDLALPTELIQRVGKNSKKFSGEKEKLPPKYIFIPFQVDSDTQIITHSPWLRNMRDFFNTIESIASKTDWHFVLKEHPSSNRNYPDLHTRASKIDNITFANSYLTQELIQNSSAVITINSTVGVESLLFHKKVIVLGDAFYNIEGVTYRASDEVSLLKIIEEIEEIVIDDTLIDNFLKYLYYDYLIPNDENVYKVFAELLKK